MARIYKYDISETSIISVPDGRIVNFGRDRYGIMCVWIQHSSVDTGEIALFVVGTGWEFSDSDTCVKSVIEGDFAWHLIKKGKSS